MGSASPWAAAIRARNAEQADAIAAAYFRYGAAIGINADLALAQACHECAWFTSRRWRAQFNPCGLGVTSDDAPGATFNSLDAGVQAHYEHLACYTMAADPPVIRAWGLHDPRHTFHDDRPLVRDLIRPERKWAVPGNGYAEAIVAIANQVTGGMTMIVGPTAEEIGYPVRLHTAADLGPPRALADIRWFIVHDTEGYFPGDEAVLTSAAPPVESAHALIGRDGTLVCMVPLDRTAWTPGNDAVAVASVNAELSGFATEPYTEEQYRSLAAFFRWCARQGCTVPAAYVGRADADGGPLPDAPGIIGHRDVPDPDHPGQWGGVAHHTDPGPHFDWQRLIALIETSGGDAADTFVSDNPFGPVPLRAPFGDRWRALDAAGLALPMMGYPKAAERTLPNGRRIQRFERGWYATQDAAAPWNVVALLPEEWPAESA
jgi:hypothetical protein